MVAKRWLGSKGQNIGTGMSVRRSGAALRFHQTKIEYAAEKECAVGRAAAIMADKS
jgi:hypothetical protein